MNQDIFEMKMKGYCCSQMIMELGLKKLDKENPDLIAAMAGLCNGVWQGKICGILSAGVCLLYLADAEEAGRTNADALSEWFYDSFGSTDCDELMEGNPLNKIEKCPVMLEATFQKIEELLEWDT
ncbi:C-GCAxxG-C-C family protein [Sinanaerobacter chloroacetimidivorans]|uniref:C_GCAxxG_C_C family protein n=1 Tax=Sinanaerobacter chloroacetimidivorans TaxID=2818044 RepID=A0A8J7W2F4_9FIRM|nr:C-GCAxxG-C-C family protein [Sinanaerobacter chloroacetimidivorans]MBR0597933.1 C_GCAxxG_C_C family protein [Sinanaerobacter chloroacetimidivorans]